VAFLSRLLDADVGVVFYDLPVLEVLLADSCCNRWWLSANWKPGCFHPARKRRMWLPNLAVRSSAACAVSADEARAMGRDVVRLRAAAKATDYAPIVREVQESGITTLARRRCSIERACHCAGSRPRNTASGAGSSRVVTAGVGGHRGSATRPVGSLSGRIRGMSASTLIGEHIWALPRSMRPMLSATCGMILISRWRRVAASAFL
jgi:hypothetical protein